ncbi:MAG TPA: sigma-54 dependent transcriptional regulator [Burkholderiales bacterium]|jgi:two-component system nitrogen regulation response regulator GlnG|nr:sigma-54 dependent transcriptional regulator [Burkholderiales bacterium]
MPTLLLIDDEPAILHAFRRVFRDSGVTLFTAGSATEGIELFAQRRPDVVILDVNLPDLSGLDAFRRIQKLDGRVPVIFITGQGTTDTAIEATKLGAYDYLLKPLELDQLRDVVARACKISSLMRFPVPVAGEEPAGIGSEVLVGRCPAMQEVYKAIGRVAPQDVTVLILGESGTGKELVARAIYHHSQRAVSMFLAINCAAIPETLLESELFGHEKGSFTGADRLRIGKFEQCSGGTLFLDEIGDMTPLTQSKILRVLQEQRFERVGGSETIQTDVRLIAATNRNLEQLVATDKFRSDLYYRLSVFTIQLPPLRGRLDDLPLLAEHFVRRFSRELGKTVQTIDPETLAILQRYSWPGNVRELQSVLKQALLQTTGPVLLPDFLPAILQNGDKSGSKITTPPPAVPCEWERFVDNRLQSASDNLYAEWLALTDRALLTQVLRHTGGNQVQAAKILGITRGTLRIKIRSLGINLDQMTGLEDDADD